MKKKVSLLHLIQNLCQLIRNQSQQSKFKLPAQSKTLYIRTQLMRAGENLKQLMDTHNLNLPPDWTFPQFTTEVIGIIFFSILQDLSLLYMVVILFIKPKIFSIFFLQGQGVVSLISGGGCISGRANRPPDPLFLFIYSSGILPLLLHPFFESWNSLPN